MSHSVPMLVWVCLWLAMVTLGKATVLKHKQILIICPKHMEVTRIHIMVVFVGQLLDVVEVWKIRLGEV